MKKQGEKLNKINRNFFWFFKYWQKRHRKKSSQSIKKNLNNLKISNYKDCVVFEQKKKKTKKNTFRK